MAATAAAQIAENVFNNAKSVAESATDGVTSYTQNAVTASQNYAVMGEVPQPEITFADFAIPPYNPDVDLAAQYQLTFDTEWLNLENWVRGLMTDWMNTYFPKIDPCIQPSEDSWLCSVVNDGYIGIPFAVEDQLWERGRAKQLLEANRMESEALDTWAAKGFSLPPGVLLARQLEVQAAAQDKASEYARDVAIKQVEISIEVTKFAIGEMTKLRLGIAQALADYIKAWMTLPIAAADIAKAKSEMQRYLWDSVSDYIRALVAKAQLEIETTSKNAELNFKAQEVDVNSFNARNQRIVEASMKAAEQLANMASAAINAQQTLANVGDASATTY
jgi:hypothetical protein